MVKASLARWVRAAALALASGCGSAAHPAESAVTRDEAFCAGDRNHVDRPPQPPPAEVEAARVACAASDSARCQFYFDHVGWDPSRPCNDLADGVATEFLVHACEKKESSACAAAAIICDSAAYRRALDGVRGAFENRCMESDAQACALASMIYDLGVGVDRDGERFFSFASSACEAGDASRCSYLALLGSRGKLANVDRSQARAWNQRAAQLWSVGCDAGNANDCLELGSETIVHFTYGPGLAPAGIPQDLGRGLALLKKACSGAPVACFTLAELYESGTLVSRNLASAADWYQRACAGGFRRACNDLGRMQAVGLGVVKDCRAARALFRKTCDAGSRVGCAALRQGVSKTMSSLELD